ncbi:MAG: DUF1704 domain-containing protein [Myxococcales bacterium]|nr:DUF1704 domain-containing protein [Myxococcales bacterium]
MTRLTDPTHRREALVALDRRLVKVASSIRVLGALSFPEQAAESFLASWRRGEPTLPEAPEPAPVKADKLDELTRICHEADREDPLGRFVYDTALSYRKVSAMLASMGSKEFHEVSRDLYGGPSDRLLGTDRTHLEAADHLLEATRLLAKATPDDGEEELSPEQVAAELRIRLDAFFVDDRIEVTLDDNLSAKAAASATRVRLRSSTRFTNCDVDQLVEHEAFVHSATALNGRKQPTLSCLSLGAPRTTATQEGIATFAELITGAIDLTRLRRLALRIRAVHLAEDGADFIDVFRYLLAVGETELESVHTSLRVFRGGDVRGGRPFTKDVVYLRGLIGVHTFLRKAIAEVRPELVRRLFVGRLTIGDVLAMEESFSEGDIVPPRYVPAWAENIRGLSAYLAFSMITGDIRINDVSMQDLLDEHGEFASSPRLSDA